MKNLHEAEVASRFDAQRRRFKSAVADDDYRLLGLLDAVGPVRGLTILDLGCGKGRFARALRRRGAAVIGVDIAAAMLAEATGVPRARASSRRLPFRDASFDAVIAVEAVEHMDPAGCEATLREARRVLRPGGRLAIVDKNVAALSARRPWLPSVAEKRIDELRGRWMYPAWGPVRERWFWPSRLRRALERRFERVDVRRLLSPAERERWLFRRLPAARLMTLWVAEAPGGRNVQ
ncbi:Demethylrebeccamycin-D-glucose O-methyltransferase [Aquisphaera giovannonii]|uniref:Demethylrebeccamycin-D-glucose O-methyltransferase n=1 Tax=Aquisphaera giovannonii TaxID=406548 RepID=A0A5B9WAS1_9BACT|nr:methyltransferase domain-containing protein [Aquisphaera giovannonii]QEH37676.1 Demethylrebeccamycin-D-glucose O-methyltransferase [Aquisphaera giovannonii]